MHNFLIYFAPFASNYESPWYSSGGNTKIKQSLNIFSNIFNSVLYVNFCPKENKEIIKTTVNICTSFSLFVYPFEILFSFYYLRKKIDKKNKNIILVVYNPRFTSLIFFISALISGYKPFLIIQMEDIPGARNRRKNFAFVDRLSLKILSKFAKHILFASPGMIKNYNELHAGNKNTSVYPPCLTKEYINTIRDRDEPFKNDFIKIMYAGGYSEEKGIFDLIEGYRKSNLLNSNLNIYGNFPQDIKKLYSKDKSIIFHDFVTDNKLYMAYANSDIVVNPHKKIENNNFIFPFKNIEIFSSGALPLVSYHSILGFEELNIENLCVYRDTEELSLMIRNCRSIWNKNKKQFQKSANKFIKKYSEERICTNLNTIFENINN